MLKIALLATALALTLVRAAGAQTKETSSPYMPFFETETGHCTIKASAEPKWKLLRVNMIRKVARHSCALAEEQTVELLSDIFEAHEKTGDRETYTSLMIGRVENYTWIQEHLRKTARDDPEWSQENGRPKTGHENHYVNAVLSLPAVLDVFDRAGKSHGYSFAAMSCEKVLIPDDGLPMDALCWIEVAQK